MLLHPLRPHHLGEQPADGEPQAGAAVAPGGRGIGLFKFGEQTLVDFRGDADPRVFDFQAQPDRRFVGGENPAAQDDAALFGEFDRVGGKVDDDLADAQGVAAEGTGEGGSMSRSKDRLLRDAFGEHRGDMVEDRLDREIAGLEHDLAGLDLGQVEDVVDDVEQVLGSVVDLAQLVELLGFRRLAQEQMGEADDGVHRVRISWLILARNALFARLAASAASRSLSEGDLGAAAHDDAPEVVGDDLQIAAIAFVVGAVPPSHAENSADAVGFEDGATSWRIPGDGHWLCVVLAGNSLASMGWRCCTACRARTRMPSQSWQSGLAVAGETAPGRGC